MCDSLQQPQTEQRYLRWSSTIALYILLSISGGRYFPGYLISPRDRFAPVSTDPHEKEKQTLVEATYSFFVQIKEYSQPHIYDLFLPVQQSYETQFPSVL